MNYTQIKEICLYISDIDQAERFCHNLLEMPVISKVEGRHIFFRCGSSVLLCFIPEVTKNEINLPPHFASGKQHIAFEVSADDYSESKQKIIRNGIEITHEQEWSDGQRSIYFEDPFGNVLELVPKGIWEG
ncbi:VOC family protein [Belliella aquatica]|uniref:Bleomycin resistance protein n=1 Tax=Belliella aquatica TaxID=1323734 RepID=A0ABQ1MJL1_9BACT|nr:VOC family protein [Belliella aquatica]MCH7405074.1 VOC family protein [Belliella aquatica]GGC39986.1 bleomycin resistance protein [Belliella aquatica]